MLTKEQSKINEDYFNNILKKSKLFIWKDYMLFLKIENNKFIIDSKEKFDKLYSIVSNLWFINNTTMSDCFFKQKRIENKVVSVKTIITSQENSFIVPIPIHLKTSMSKEEKNKQEKCNKCHSVSCDGTFEKYKLEKGNQWSKNQTKIEKDKWNKKHY